jgi:hypothetical protein
LALVLRLRTLSAGHEKIAEIRAAETAFESHFLWLGNDAVNAPQLVANAGHPW